MSCIVLVLLGSFSFQFSSELNLWLVGYIISFLRSFDLFPPWNGGLHSVSVQNNCYMQSPTLAYITSTSIYFGDD